MATSLPYLAVGVLAYEVRQFPELLEGQLVLLAGKVLRHGLEQVLILPKLLLPLLLILVEHILAWGWRTCCGHG